MVQPFRSGAYIWGGMDNLNEMLTNSASAIWTDPQTLNTSHLTYYIRDGAGLTLHQTVALFSVLLVFMWFIGSAVLFCELLVNFLCDPVGGAAGGAWPLWGVAELHAEGGWSRVWTWTPRGPTSRDSGETHLKHGIYRQIHQRSTALQKFWAPAPPLYAITPYILNYAGKVWRIPVECSPLFCTAVWVGSGEGGSTSSPWPRGL